MEQEEEAEEAEVAEVVTEEAAMVEDTEEDMEEVSRW